MSFTLFKYTDGILKMNYLCYKKLDVKTDNFVKHPKQVVFRPFQLVVIQQNRYYIANCNWINDYLLY